MFWRRKKQKGAEYPEQLDLTDLERMAADAYIMGVQADPKYIGSNSIRPSGNVFGNELYSFVGSVPTHGYNHAYTYGDGDNLIIFIVCSYCGSRNKYYEDMNCKNCGAPL